MEYDLPGGGRLGLFGNKDMKSCVDAGACVALEVDDLDSEGNSLFLHELNKKQSL